MMMNDTIMKGIIIILLLALIRVSFRYTEMKSMLIQCQEICTEMQVINDGLIAVDNELIQEIKSIVIQYQKTCAEMQEINDGLINVNTELLQEVDKLNDIIKEESKDAGNGTE